MASSGPKPCSQSPQWKTRCASLARRESASAVNIDVCRCEDHIPPVAADGFDVFGLQRLGEHDAAARSQERRHVLKAGARGNGVLDDLEAGDQAEFSLRAGGAGKRIVIGDVGETVRGHAISEGAGAGAVVQDVDVTPICEAFGNQCGDVAGADVGVFGVDPGIVGVVDVGGEFFRRPVVEEGGEYEAAVLAAVVVDVDPGEAEGETGWWGSSICRSRGCRTAGRTRRRACMAGPDAGRCWR